MELYEIPRNSKIRLPIYNEATDTETVEVCDFKHVDGMYSLIYTPNGHAVHLGRFTEVKLVDGIYELV